MNIRRISIVLVSVVFVTITGFVSWYQTSTPKEIAVEQVPVDDFSASDYNFNDRDLMENELHNVKMQMQEMYAVIEQLKKDVANNTALDGGFNHSQPANEVTTLYSQIINNPDKARKLKQYQAGLELSTLNMTNEFFDTLPDSDEAWSADSQAFIADSLLQSDVTRDRLQVTESKCKSGVCKFSIEITHASDVSDVDLMAIEHKMLVSMSKKFPSSRIRPVERNGEKYFEGYLTDGSVALPRDSGILSDRRITPEELRAIVQ